MKHNKTAEIAKLRAENRELRLKVAAAVESQIEMLQTMREMVSILSDAQYKESVMRMSLAHKRDAAGKFKK